MFKRPIILPLLILILSIILVDAFLPTFFLKNHYSKHLEESSCFKYLILNSGKKTDHGTNYTAKVIDYYDYDNRLWKSTCGKVKLFVPNKIQQKFVYGDVVVSTDKLKSIENYSSHFNYKRYMRHQRIYHQVYINSFRRIQQNKGNFIIRIAQRTNDYLKERMEYSGLSKDESSLAIAMLLGDKNEMNPEIRSAFNVSGIAHILCVSGLHIMLILMSINWLLKIFLHNSLKSFNIRIYSLVILSWIIALIVGLTPSAVRVAFMLSILLLCKKTPLTSDRLNTLLVVGFFLLVLDPLSLFNISFQLSFLSLLGIILFKPIISNWIFRFNISEHNIYKKFVGNISTTTAAQCFCLPIILIDFNRFPVFFLITNLIVIPLMQIILISLIVFLIFVDVPLLNTALSFFVGIEMDFLIFIAKGTDALTTLIF